MMQKGMSKKMQQIQGYMRKAITHYSMIQPGDHVALGISGGKDSLAMLVGLAALRRYLSVPFTLTAITLDPCFSGEESDFSAVDALCKTLSVPYILKRTDIGSIIFDIRKETNPCSLCARMRRGALHDLCNELGANKLALGHNKDDAVETFIMNLFNEGRIGCFSPMTYLSRKNITMIRPLVFAPEEEVLAAVRRAKLPVVQSRCPVDKSTNRQHTKQWLLEMERATPGFQKRIFGALCRSGISDW